MKDKFNLKIIHNFVRSDSGEWYNLDNIKIFCAKDCKVMITFLDDYILCLKSFDNDEQAQNCLDHMFNVYKFHDCDLFDILYDFNLYISNRSEGALKNADINTVGKFFDMISRNIKPVGIGQKSWNELEEISYILAKHLR